MQEDRLFVLELAKTAPVGRGAAPARQRVGSPARKVALYGLPLPVSSLLSDVEILAFFGIARFAVRMAAEIVIADPGWQLLGHAEGSGDPPPRSTLWRHRRTEHSPLTLPLTVGPGSISTAIGFEALEELLGDTGTEILNRLSAFVLFVLGLQVLWNGRPAVHRSL